MRRPLGAANCAEQPYGHRRSASSTTLVERPGRRAPGGDTWPATSGLRRRPVISLCGTLRRHYRGTRARHVSLEIAQIAPPRPRHDDVGCRVGAGAVRHRLCRRCSSAGCLTAPAAGLHHDDNDHTSRRRSNDVVAPAAGAARGVRQRRRGVPVQIWSGATHRRRRSDSRRMARQRQLMCSRRSVAFSSSMVSFSVAV